MTQLSKERSVWKKAALDASKLILDHDQKILNLENERLEERDKNTNMDITEWLKVSNKYGERKAEITRQYASDKTLIKNWDKVIKGLNVRDKRDRFSKRFYNNPDTAIKIFLMIRYEVPCKKCGHVFYTRLGFVPKVFCNITRESFSSLCPNCQNIKTIKRYCVVCKKEIPSEKRSHTLTCSDKCRKKKERKFKGNF